MIYQFHAYGHPNILGTHKTTLEFTKDEDVSKKGNCIVGVKADFELSKLKEFIEKNGNGNVKMTIEAPDKKIRETIHGTLNPNFNSDREMVIRKTGFISERTLMINVDKAAFGLKRELVDFLRLKNNKTKVALESAVAIPSYKQNV